MTVIKFPKENPRVVVDEYSDIGKLQEKIDNAKEKYINALVDQHSSQLLAGISLSGFDIDQDSFMKDFSFTVETIRSSLYRNLGLTHPLHQSIDEVVELIEKDDDENDISIFDPLTFSEDDIDDDE